MVESRLHYSAKNNYAEAKLINVVMMFKIMKLQRYYNLGDKQVEYHKAERMSFKKFLGIESCDKVPTEKTIYVFREKLTQTASVEEQFEFFSPFRTVIFDIK